MHFRQCRFKCSACGPFTKSKTIIQKFKQTRDFRYIYKNDLDKACFQHDMAHGDFIERLILTKYYAIRHLQLLAIHIRMDIIANLHHWSTNSLVKNLQTSLLISGLELFLNINNYLS